MIETRYLVTIKTEYIDAIISKEEVEILLDKNDIKDLDNMALISISDPVYKKDEPERAPLEEKYSKQFKSYLSVSFWDQTTDEGDKKIISKELVKEIQEFILKNKDKNFIVNCNAGVSRSAGIGLLIHYTLGGYKDMYDFKTSFDDVISKHYRYSPNLTPLDQLKD